MTNPSKNINSHTCRKITAIIIIIVCSTYSSYSQTQSVTDSVLASIQKLYDTGMFVSSELEARRFLEQKDISDSTKILFEQQIAFSLVAQGKTQSASDHFISILSYDPNYELDPILTSPKILTSFNEAKLKFLSRQNKKKENIQPLQIPTIPSVTFRAIIFPGWEQIYQGRQTVGYSFLGAGAASLAVVLYFDIQRREWRKDYLSATAPSLIQSRYDSYNSYQKTEIYSAIAFGIIYFASEVDAFFNLPKTDISISASSSNYGKMLSLSIPLQ